MALKRQRRGMTRSELGLLWTRRDSDVFSLAQLLNFFELSATFKNLEFLQRNLAFWFLLGHWEHSSSHTPVQGAPSGVTLTSPSPGQALVTLEAPPHPVYNLWG